MSLLEKCLQTVLLEAYSDKVDIIKRYLDNNFMRASFMKNGKTYNIFVLLQNHIPTDKSMWKQDVIDILDEKFNKIITDKDERNRFFNRIVEDWYLNAISPYGSLSKYDF